MNIVILFILNILIVLFSHASSQNALGLQRYQSRTGSMRNIFENITLGQTPTFSQGETPIFGLNIQIQDGDTPINPILVQSVVASPISPSLELMFKEVFNDYYYNHPCVKKLILNDLEEKERIFLVFLNFLKADNSFLKVDNDNLEKKFRDIYKIDEDKEFTQDQELEFEKYIKHEEAKEKIRYKWMLEKKIDIFIEEENKKIETV